MDSARPLTIADMWFGTTLDPVQMAQQVLALAVPGLADAGIVYVLEPLLASGGQRRRELRGPVLARRLAVSTPTGGPPPWNDYPPDSEMVVLSPEMPHARCLVTGEPTAFELATPAGQASMLGMPLTARGEVTGMVLLGRMTTGRPFEGRDIARAAALAGQAGVCIDNARLFDAERRIADALQRGLLPRDPPAPQGLDISHCYRPAGDHMVGGDWYDVVPLPRGRTAIIVGDTMGHGPEAATVMVQLRAAAHVLADMDLTPDALLWRLNRMAATVTLGTFATCVCAVIDPVAGTGIVGRAGHLPPVLALPDGSCEVVELAPGLPLGLGGDTYSTATVALPPGSVLALYTDGLVESRTRPFDEGIAELRDALAEGRAPVQATCDAIVDQLCQRGEDDTTLVLVRIP